MPNFKSVIRCFRLLTLIITGIPPPTHTHPSHKHTCTYWKYLERRGLWRQGREAAYITEVNRHALKDLGRHWLPTNQLPGHRPTMSDQSCSLNLKPGVMNDIHHLWTKRSDIIDISFRYCNIKLFLEFHCLDKGNWSKTVTWHLVQSTWLTSEASCTGDPRPFSSVLGSRPFVPQPMPLGYWRIVPSETIGYLEYFPCLHPCNVITHDVINCTYWQRGIMLLIQSCTYKACRLSSWYTYMYIIIKNESVEFIYM